MPAGQDIRIPGVGDIVIPADALEWRFVRSSGPGGQHVNRTSSKAVLRYGVRHSPHLPDDVRRRLLAALAPRLTKEGDVLIVSQDHRDRARNMAECRDKLAQLVARAAVPPKRRRRTKVPRSAVAGRLDAKRLRGRVKKLRRPPVD